MLYKETEATEFIASDKPVEVLGTYNVLTFKSEEGQTLQRNPATDEEVCSSLHPYRFPPLSPSPLLSLSV